MALAPVVSDGTWQVAQPAAAKTPSPAAPVAAAPLERRQEAHEAGEVVDAAPPGPRVDDVFRVGNRIADPHPGRVHADGQLAGEQVVGDPHLVAIGVGGECQQGRVLGLPPEPADPPRAGAAILDNGRPAAHAVAAAALVGRQREQGVVVDGFDQAGAEDRNRHPADDHVGFDRDERLAGVAGDREQVEERLAVGLQCDERAIGPAQRGPDLGHRADAADRGHAVADRATGGVERRAQPLFGGLDLEEVVEAEPELLELDRGQTRERVAGLDGARLTSRDERRGPDHRRHAQ